MKIDSEAKPLHVLESIYGNEVKLGGRWRPLDCRSHSRVAIIVPYRNREHHLSVFLNHMHTLLRRQEIDYGIFVIEEVDVSSSLLSPNARFRVADFILQIV